MFVRCSVCNKVKVNGENLKKFRILVFSTSAISGLVGYFALPLLGFTLTGVRGASMAAAWHSKLGAVSGGSLFSILQSLGATGIGNLLFGSVGSALPMMSLLAPKLKWCNTNHDDEESPPPINTLS